MTRQRSKTLLTAVGLVRIDQSEKLFQDTSIDASVPHFDDHQQCLAGLPQSRRTNGPRDRSASPLPCPSTPDRAVEIPITLHPHTAIIEEQMLSGRTLPLPTFWWSKFSEPQFFTAGAKCTFPLQCNAKSIKLEMFYVGGEAQTSTAVCITQPSVAVLRSLCSVGLSQSWTSVLNDFALPSGQPGVLTVDFLDRAMPSWAAVQAAQPYQAGSNKRKGKWTVSKQKRAKKHDWLLQTMAARKVYDDGLCPSPCPVL